MSASLETSIDPVLAAFADGWYLDHTAPDAGWLPPALPDLAGSRQGENVALRRIALAGDWLVRSYLPLALREARLPGIADQLASLPEISDLGQAGHTLPALRSAWEATEPLEAEGILHQLYGALIAPDRAVTDCSLPAAAMAAMARSEPYTPSLLGTEYLRVVSLCRKAGHAAIYARAWRAAEGISEHRAARLAARKAMTPLRDAIVASALHRFREAIDLK